MLLFRRTSFRRFVKTRRPEPTRYIVVGFLLIILLGSIFLSLPMSSRNGTHTPFLNALFTSTSATCVTGLVVYDTYTHWSVFGQTVILLLIQIGGLGFMTVAGLFSLITKRKLSHKEHLLMTQSLNLFDMTDVKRLLRDILVGTFSLEASAAVILTVRFIPDYGFVRGLGTGIFTSISAFCNAGFDLMGGKTPFASLTGYSDDIVVNITVMLLIIIGGLGFFVWEDLVSARSFHKLSIFSKLVLVFTVILILSGTVLILFFECDNPFTIGTMSVKGKVLSSFFQSVTARTAGFNTINIAGMRDITKVLMILLMFVGGSSGSTAGGVKVGTVAVIMCSTIAVISGKNHATTMKRRISDETVVKAFVLVTLSAALILLCSFVICSVEGLKYLDVLFECVSAFCTVGLTLGVTTQLSGFSLSVLMMLMYLGRVGLITASFALMNTSDSLNKIQYPECKLIIG